MSRGSGPILWALLGSLLVGAWGLRWDIQWHERIGRDSFWIAPHLMTYAGVTLLVLLSFGVLLHGTLRYRAAPVRPPMVRLLGLVGTPGFHLAAWGIALTVLAAPIDDLWHRLFGLDVTLWSPPHLLGLAGAAVNTLACLMIAREVYPAAGAKRLAATLFATAMFYGNLRTVASPAFDLAHHHGGVAYHSYAILGGLLFPLALIVAACLTGLRAGPLLMAIVSLLIRASSDLISTVGFAVIQPVSIIRGDPRAIADSRVLMLASFVPVLVLVGIDARRHPLAGSLGYAVTLFAVFGWIQAASPALGRMAPGAETTLVALALTVVATFAGAAVGRRLARALQG